MEKNRVFVVTEYYTPYKHNNCTEANHVTIFDELRNALDYVSGTDGNGKLRPYIRRARLTLKQDCKPMYEIGTNYNGGITLKVNEDCIDANALTLGGYVYKVSVEPFVVNTSVYDIQ